MDILNKFNVSTILNISEKEKTKLYFVAGIFFLLTLGFACGRIARDAIFIQEVGASQLPIIYIFNAILMVLLAIIYSHSYHYFSSGTYLIGLIVVSSLTIVGLRYTLTLEGDNKFYVLYVLTEAIILIIPMHFWTFASEIFDSRESKRIFPLIGGAGLIATIIGGLITSAFAHAVGTVNLIILWLCILLITIPLIILFRKFYGRISEESFPTGNLIGNLNNILDIPLLRTLSYIALPMWLTIYIMDYQFFIAIEESFKTQNETSVALGIIQGVTSGLGFLLQLLLTRLLIEKLGVGRAVIILPGAMVLGSIAFIIRLALPLSLRGLFSMRMMPAIFARVTDESFLPSIGETSFQLLYNSIVDELRGHARAFVNGMIEPISIALAGVVLIIFGALDLPVSLLPFLSLTTGLVWLYLSFRIRSDYMDALVENINSHSIDMQDQARNEFTLQKDSESIKLLQNSLFAADEDVALMAVEMLAKKYDVKTQLNLAESIISIPHKSVQLNALKALRDLNALHCFETLLPLLKKHNTNILAATIQTLGILSSSKSKNILTQFLLHDNSSVHDEALIALLRPMKRLDKRSKTVLELYKMMDSTDYRVQKRLARIIHQSSKNLLTPALVKIVRQNNSASEVAINALGQVGSTKDANFLIQFLVDKKLKHAAMEAIQNIGKDSVKPLLNLIPSSNEEQKINILICLGKIADGSTVEPLIKLLSGESIDVEDKALESLAMIHQKLISEGGLKLSQYYFNNKLMHFIKRGMAKLGDAITHKSIQIKAIENLATSNAQWLLLDAIKRSYHRKEKAALLYLELLADPLTIRAAGADLHTGVDRTRAKAIEVIEGSSPAGARLAEILDTIYNPNENETQITPSESDLEDILRDQLLTKEKPWLYSAALFAIGEYKFQSLKDIVKSHLGDPNFIIHSNALIAFQKLGGRITTKQKREVKKMAVNMERMLFLRSVSLFSEVDGDDIYWINEITREVNYAKGNIIFRENDKGDALYIILSGDVQILKEGKKRIVLDLFTKRDCFGEMAILDQEPRSATAKALKNTRLLRIKQDDFHRLLLARPQIGFSLFKTLSLRLRQLSAHLKEVELSK